MPLQKPRSDGTPTIDPQTTKRPQMQERRRTLQTISELSATATTIPDLRAYARNSLMPQPTRSNTSSNGRRTPNSHKRRSLQYCARPECVEIRSPPPVPSIHRPATQRTSSHRSSHMKSPQPYEAGWNARRELARKQAEQALSGTSIQREPSMPDLQLKYRPALPDVSPSSHSKPHEPYLRSYYSQQHSLRNSRSMSSTTSRPERRLSNGAPPQDTRYEAEPSVRTSTDSSSFRSSRSSAIRRSRSSSSSQSFTLQGVPPLPSGCAQPINPYYSTLHSPYHNGYPIQLPGPMYAQAPSEMRASSLPYMTGRHSFTGVSTALYSHPPSKQHGHAQKIPRPKSLSSQTSTGHQQSLSKRSSQSSIKSQSRRRSTHQQGFPPPPPVQPHTQSTPPSHHHPSPSHLPPRPLPNRTSLTKWASERAEIRAEFNGMQRARVQERVRRANEMEQEKERELQMVGKGAGKAGRVLGVGLEEEREGGCFGGWKWKLGRGKRWVRRWIGRWK